MEKEAKPEAARASEADKNTPDDFYFSFLTGLLPLSENLEMKCGICTQIGVHVCVCVHESVCMG